MHRSSPGETAGSGGDKSRITEANAAHRWLQRNGTHHALKLLNDVRVVFPSTDKTYPGYEVPTNYTQAYTQWATNSLGGIQGALQSANLQSTQFQSEDALFSQLQSLSDGSVGHMQVLQVGNMIGVAEVQQLEKLRQLQMAQLQGEFDYLATQQQNDLVKFATLRAWLDSQQNYKSSE